MPVNGQSIGKDVTLTISVAGLPFKVEPSAVVSFDPSPDTGKETRKGLDGKVRHIVVPDGGKGSIEIDRLSSVVEDFWYALEQAYYSGQNVPSGQIIETIRNPDGSVSQWRYEDCVFDLTNYGSRMADQIIKQRLDFMFSRRIKI